MSQRQDIDPGPFPTEHESVAFPELHNAAHPWMGSFRKGYFDMVAARYAIGEAKPDSIALTHCDAQTGGQIAVEYEGGEIQPASDFTERLLSERPRYEHGSILSTLDQRCPVSLAFTGPSAKDGARLRRLKAA